MKLNKSVIFGLVVFLIFWIVSLSLEVLWLSYIGLVIFLIFSVLDVFRRGDKKEIKTQIILIILIILLQIIAYFY
ncbi:hypothetical protein MXL65_13255 [Mammaliicoccus sciuri]|uniref:hypothetical protein n=1 Tax=Mammaliicoccus sciuri TaxID=1296 RepID=UPI00195205EE|nr:hypothetical protein [Mammaliicoccus sciuri]MEB6216185.1 hypothetical protein [Mammaliicoccus sciuri]MEB6331323.1 hypothetical protein [Mammaliicoccus sciuri]MEB7466221.1 hypothetical protein [Mammaliicoccus sciuri]